MAKNSRKERNVLFFEKIRTFWTEKNAVPNPGYRWLLALELCHHHSPSRLFHLLPFLPPHQVSYWWLLALELYHHSSPSRLFHLLHSLPPHQVSYRWLAIQQCHHPSPSRLFHLLHYLPRTRWARLGSKVNHNQYSTIQYKTLLHEMARLSGGYNRCLFIWGCSSW